MSTIAISSGHAILCSNRQVEDDVTSLADIVVQGTRYTAIEHTKVKAQVGGSSLLPFQVGIRIMADAQLVFTGKSINGGRHIFSHKIRTD